MLSLVKMDRSTMRIYYIIISDNDKKKIKKMYSLTILMLNKIDKVLYGSIKHL